jgi:hypothetical protein
LLEKLFNDNLQKETVGGGIERWALVEQALIYHHALLQSIELLPLHHDTILNLYRSKAHWDGEPPGAILHVQYAKEDITHLRYAINSRVLHDKTGIVRYTPDALIAVLTQHRERSTLWRTLEQEVSADIVTVGGAMMRTQPLRLPNFVDVALERFYAAQQSSWMEHVPDFIDDTFGKLNHQYEKPEGDIVSLDAWRMRSERSKQ